jgi:hypothetical protein
MITNDKPIPSADQSSTDQLAPTPTDEIAISASELVKMIESGQGTDVSELVNRLLHDRQAA